ncbi:hypothetical protein ACFVT6_24040 [Streptomyces sp. NPDC058049]|uniref:hypothetical protein n=1 Tax=Streptomyces sp. NPDC058049 TaxID=3346314 RepID=UPI0036DFBAA3
MEMIAVRDVRGSLLSQFSREGRLVGIQNNRALIGVILPASPQLTRNVIEDNWSNLMHTIKRGEVEASGKEWPNSLAALQDRLVGDDASTTAPATLPPNVGAVRVGDLSAGLIEEAGREGRALTLTHNRELIGVLVPITPRLVQSLVERNLSQVLHDIEMGEKQIQDREPATTPGESEA